MLHLSLLLLFVGTALSDVVNDKRWVVPMLDGRIVGGMRVNITEAPYQVSLNTNAFGHFCGGSIIGKRWILTAAHCTDNYKNQAVPLLRVRAGSSRRRSGGELIYVKKIYQHSKFSMRTVDYDFSILELTKDLTLDDTRQPITMPVKDQAVVEGTVCTITGWGHTKNTRDSNSYLRGTKVPVANQEKCKQAYKGLGTITDRMFCAGYTTGGKDACQGDSGGPLVQDNVLIGVISWGYGCAKPDYPGVYSRIASVRDWIKETCGI